MAQFVSDLPSIEFEVNDETITLYFKVTSYFPGSPGKSWGHPDTWEPSEYEEIEYDLFDEKGNIILDLKEIGLTQAQEVELDEHIIEYKRG
jgi:hypothetical protein